MENKDMNFLYEKLGFTNFEEPGKERQLPKLTLDVTPEMAETIKQHMDEYPGTLEIIDEPQLTIQNIILHVDEETLTWDPEKFRIAKVSETEGILKIERRKE